MTPPPSSTPSPPPPSPPPSSCFPSVAKVKLANGKSVPMSELKIGDQVQTGTEHQNILSNILYNGLHNRNDIIVVEEV